MSSQSKAFIVRQLIASGIVLAVFLGWSPIDEALRFSFFFGLSLYLGNLILLTIVVDRLFRSSGEGELPPSMGSKGLSFLALIKLIFTGVGLYIGLAVLRLHALLLVAGAVAGLAATTVSSLVLGKKRLF